MLRSNKPLQVRTTYAKYIYTFPYVPIIRIFPNVPYVTFVLPTPSKFIRSLTFLSYVHFLKFHTLPTYIHTFQSYVPTISGSYYLRQVHSYVPTICTFPNVPYVPYVHSYVPIIQTLIRTCTLYGVRSTY
jgi:hypothetical protein